MKVLLTGAGGQLGQEFISTKPEFLDLIALNREELDVTKTSSVEDALHKYKPDVLINAAAYTAVDLAEQNSETAFDVNANGVANLVSACVDSGCRLIHISTDYVFDGRQSTPYQVADKTNPLNVYGKSKLSGEGALLESLVDGIVVRSGWLYSPYGKNFLKTILHLLKTKNELRIISDQVGGPTYARNLARHVWLLVEHWPGKGVFHFADKGEASWYDFAAAIQEEALALRLIEKRKPIQAISTKDYASPTSRPAYSVLESSGCFFEDHLFPRQSWREALRDCLKNFGKFYDVPDIAVAKP